MNDGVAEWLRRWTANPLGSARVGSNPIPVGILFKHFLVKLKNMANQQNCLKSKISENKIKTNLLLQQHLFQISCSSFYKFYFH